MTARERVRRATRLLAGSVALAALLWAVTLGMAVISLAAVLDDLRVLGSSLRVAIIPLALLGALAAAMLVLWRGRAARSIESVALWLEEREPRLQYALVTAIDPSIAPAQHHPELHQLASRADVDGAVRRASRRSLGRALVVCASLIGIVLVLQPQDLMRASRRELALRAAPAPPAPLANRLLAISARVAPPAYSRLPSQTVKEPNNVAALIGSQVTVEGDGAPDGVTGTVGPSPLVATAGDRGWALGVVMPKDPAVITLRDRSYKRLLSLEPVVDSAPDVRLQLPLHDTVYQAVPKGKLEIEAGVADDIGLNYGYVEYLLSIGSEEKFDTKLVNGSRIPFDNARRGTLRSIVDLDTMKLSPGSVLHIRVVAYDYNDVTGPGKGVSETRTLKIAEPPDSTSINAAPPLPIDSMWISQRLLNMRTDTLIRGKRAMPHEDFVHKSSGYGNAQEDIRKRALAVIALLEDNGVGESFQTEISTKLREATALMWTAREDLSVAQPDSAMPLMKRILKILDDIRLANRYYLRGILKPVAVDIAKARLTGKDSASVAARAARQALADAQLALASRIDAAASLARTAPGDAADSLVYIRIAALRSAPAVASALDQAITLLRKGASADSALGRTRRALEPPSRTLRGPTEWVGVLP